MPFLSVIALGTARVAGGAATGPGGAAGSSRGGARPPARSSILDHLLSQPCTRANTNTVHYGPAHQWPALDVVGRL